MKIFTYSKSNMFVSLCKVKKDNHLYVQCALLMYKEMVEQFNGDVKISLKVCKDGHTRDVGTYCNLQ